jgi:hypothetical protein
MTSHDSILADRWDTSISFTFGIRNVCTYCGDPADVLDHVVPWSYLSAVVRKGSQGHDLGIRTWACRECNSILGHKRFPCMWRRIVHVNDRLRVRLDEHLAYPIWQREELRHLGPNLRRQAEARNLLTRVARARVGWIFSPMCLGIMENVRDRVCDESSPDYREIVARFFAP